MGLFNIFKKPVTPVESKDDLFYELLFCDDLNLFEKQNLQSYPWNILFSEKHDTDKLYEIINDKDIESRVKLLAYKTLGSLSIAIEKKELLGVIVEVGLENGLDVLASYKDGTARYINQSGRIIIWEGFDEASKMITDRLFNKSLSIVSQIGPWDKPRRPKPQKDVARISFLVSDGLYFGEGPVNILFNDPMAGPALATAAELMKYIIEKSSKA